MAAAEYDLPAIRRGNTGTITFRLKDGDDPFDLTGSEMVLRVTARGTEIIRETTADDGLSMPTPSNGEVSFEYSVAQSRLLPAGSIAKYELERRIDGNERTLVYGRMPGAEGVNDDE